MRVEHPAGAQMSYQPELWDQEYGTLRVIPSTSRALPSKALLLFSEILDFRGYNKVLDAGCGNGRNSVYLAKKGCEVHAIDSSERALIGLKQAATAANVADRITIYDQSLQPSFPFENDLFDLVLDSYVFCHIVDDEMRQTYRSELRRVTRPGGLVFSSVFSVEDEYYHTVGQFAKMSEKVVTDPNNRITKRLYTYDEISTFFRADFEIPYFAQFEFDDVVLDKIYRRSILASILKRAI